MERTTITLMQLLHYMADVAPSLTTRRLARVSIGSHFMWSADARQRPIISEIATSELDEFARVTIHPDDSVTLEFDSGSAAVAWVLGNAKRLEE